MKLKLCVACGAKEDLQHHRLVVREDGGGDEETNLLTFCPDCAVKFERFYGKEAAA